MRTENEGRYSRENMYSPSLTDAALEVGEKLQDEAQGVRSKIFACEQVGSHITFFLFLIRRIVDKEGVTEVKH